MRRERFGHVFLIALCLSAPAFAYTASGVDDAANPGADNPGLDVTRHAMPPPDVTAKPAETPTVAGAALLQRAAGAIAKANGTIQSSQVDVAGSQGGMVKLQISCEIAQSDLQRLLYDLEAGMPFLFVNELTAEMPQAVGANDGIGRMHVQLALSGEWQGAAR